MNRQTRKEEQFRTTPSGVHQRRWMGILGLMVIAAMLLPVPTLAGRLSAPAAEPTVTVLPKLGPMKPGSDADDPAIWIHPTDPSKSLMFLSDKSGAIFVYDFSGKQLQAVRFGSTLNNIDVRKGFKFGNETIDIVAANLRAAGKLAVLRINPGHSGSNALSVLADDKSANNTISPTSYGFTLYRRPSDGAMFVFDKTKGSQPIVQWRLSGDNGQISVTKVRDFKDVAIGQAEGFVADDELGFVYFAEETKGIHKYNANPDSGQNSRLSFFASGDGTANDREGLALYKCNDGSGYLVLSSQGNSSFKVYERQSNAFVKTFIARESEGTDGLDVSSSSAPGFPNGFAVIHDDNQMQYYVYDWADIAQSDLKVCPNGGAGGTPTPLPTTPPPTTPPPTTPPPTTPPSGDFTPPALNAFTASSTATSGAVSMSWSVSDVGGSHLKQIQVWRAADLNGSPDPFSWHELRRLRQTAFDSLDSDQGQGSDSPPIGVWWYRLHAVDNDGNWSFWPSPIKTTKSSTASSAQPFSAWSASSSFAFSRRVTKVDAVPFAQASSFRFVSWGDTKSATSVLSALSDQAIQLDPVLTLYAGDLESSGFTQSGMDKWKSAMNGQLSGDTTSNGMFDRTFPVRGNHDNGNTAGWQGYYNLSATAAAVGATNYAFLSGQDDLTYSFDFGNSHFIGVDVTGDADKISSQQVAWIDQDLSAAEGRGLVHAFIVFHGPIYCVDGHCSYNTRVASTPAQVQALIKVLNRHPIITATFHGHEHTYAYTYLDSTRIPASGSFEGVTRPFHQFVTGDAGAGPDSCNANRCDYNMAKHGFVTVDVSGATLTVNFYQQGNNTPVKTYTLTKSGVVTPTPPPTTPPPTTPPPTTPPPTTPPPSGAFQDVPANHWAFPYIEALFRAGYIKGCRETPAREYCPEDPLTRAQEAVFVLRGVFGASHTPPQPSSPPFIDVPLSHWAVEWVDELKSQHYTAGCSSDGASYCPDALHTVAEGAVFFSRMLNGPNFTPPTPSRNPFIDLPANAWYTKWLVYAFNAGLLGPCRTSPAGAEICPNDPLPRDLAAYIMTNAKALPIVP